MGDDIYLFTLSESTMNAIKKPGLVQKIIALKGKVDSDISNLCNQISKLNDTITQLHSTNKKIRSELAVVKNVNTKLEERIISLEKNQAKSEQHSRRNSIQLSGIPNHIPENNLEKVVVERMFILDYFSINWNEILKPEEQNIDYSTEIFLNQINELLDNFAPFKKINKYKLKFNWKP